MHTQLKTNFRGKKKISIIQEPMNTILNST